MISHSEDKKPFKCEYCVTRFSNKSHLNRHIKFAHFSNTINCSHCEEKFSKKGDLYRHLYTHTKVKPFACYFPFCKRSYFKQGKLQSHINSYHLQKNYITAYQLDKELELSKSNNISCETMEQSIIEAEDIITQSLNNNNQDIYQSKNKIRKFFKCPFKLCKNFYTRVEFA